MKLIDPLYKVLVAPCQSEKAYRIGNQVVFKVVKCATKIEVKKAVEALFDVKVKNVNVLNQKGKVKRFGQQEGKRKDWKKAYVTLAEGYDIQFGK